MLTIALAALLAVLGSAAVVAYVRQANNRAVAGLKAETVLAARSAIPAGTSLNAAQRDGLLVPETFPVASVPADAIRSIGPYAAKVTSAAVQQGQLLTTAMLADSVQGPPGAVYPQTDLLVSVQLCLPQAVAGYVVRGSYVAVFDTYGNKLNVEETCESSHSTQATGKVYTRVVLTRALVVSVGTSSAAAQGGTSALDGPTSASAAQGAVFVTLAVDQADAEKLIQVQQVGLPYLALLTPHSVTTSDTPPQLFDARSVP